MHYRKKKAAIVFFAYTFEKHNSLQFLFGTIPKTMYVYKFGWIERTYYTRDVLLYVLYQRA